MVPGQTRISIARGYKNILGRDDVVGGCPYSSRNLGSAKRTKTFSISSQEIENCRLVHVSPQVGVAPRSVFGVPGGILVEQQPGGDGGGGGLPARQHRRRVGRGRRLLEVRRLRERRTQRLLLRRQGGLSVGRESERRGELREWRSSSDTDPRMD